MLKNQTEKKGKQITLPSATSSVNEILNHRHVPEAEKKSFDKLKFLGVDIVDGDKIMINASSSKDSQLLRDFLEGLGIQFEITYEGMCG